MKYVRPDAAFHVVAHNGAAAALYCSSSTVMCSVGYHMIPLGHSIAIQWSALRFIKSYSVYVFLIALD